MHRGADIVIAQGVEAGGHVQGTTPLVQLLREMRAELEIPIVAAGGIADGVSARAAVAEGADAVACGTAFLAAREADVHPAYLAGRALAGEVTGKCKDTAGRIPRLARLDSPRVGLVVGLLDAACGSTVTELPQFGRIQPTCAGAGIWAAR